jgi:serine/threonine protein kinase
LYLLKRVVQGVEKWVHIRDCDNPLKFGVGAKNSALNKNQGWLWEGKGQLVILSSPSIKGKHYATSVKQLLGVVNHLEQLHQLGYVPGDIRAYNVLFVGDAGYLIDFDTSGSDEESTRYPEGYNRCLKDGSRKGTEGARIRKWHDWRDLIFILFVLHQVDPPMGALKHFETEHDELRHLRKERALNNEKLFVCDNFADKEDTSSIDIGRVKEFLIQADGWNVSPSQDFRTELTERGLLGAGSVG